eukprot:gene2144-28025_t
MAVALLLMVAVGTVVRSSLVLDAVDVLASTPEIGALPAHARIMPGKSPLRGTVHHKWASDCISARFATSSGGGGSNASGGDRNLWNHINALVTEAHSKGKPVKETESNGFILPLSVNRMQPSATAAYGALEAATQVAFSALRESVGGRTAIQGRIKLANVDVHVMPAPSMNYSYELEYSSRNQLGYSGLYVVQGQNMPNKRDTGRASDCIIAFADPRGDTPNTPQARVPDYVFDHREPATIKLDLNLLLIFPGNLPRQPKCGGSSSSFRGAESQQQTHAGGDAPYSTLDTAMYITFDIEDAD